MSPAPSASPPPSTSSSPSSPPSPSSSSSSSPSSPPSPARRAPEGDAHPLAFLAAPTPPADLRGGWEPTDDERLLRDAVRAFVDGEVLPRSPALEAGDLPTLRRLFAGAAELGLTGLGVPERYGGLGAGVTAAMLVAAELGRQESFATSLGAHLGIGSLALVLFGSEELRERYLPQLVAAERIGAYALTEPDAGSDALGLKSRATPRPGGGWTLAGTKQFITNAGIAGLYTVFAQVGGDRLTAFLVRGEQPGVVPGAFEHKMGLRGSPTASVTFEGVEVAAGHVLGEIGKGHRVAFNVLNLGRLKLGFDAVGCAREALAESCRYAAQRRQFGRPIGSFGLIRDKLAAMAARIYALESVCLRLARSHDRALGGVLGEVPSAHAVSVLKAHAAPCALLKFASTEHLGFVADQAVQIHGGYGFVEEYPVCRIYRDVRVKRIFEGTNEVNRLLAAGTLLRRGVAGDFDLPALLDAGRAAPPDGRDLAGVLRWCLGRVCGLATARFGPELADRQLVLAGIADLAAELYFSETTAARAAADGSDRARALVALAEQGARERALPVLARLAPAVGEDASALLAPVGAGSVDVAAARDLIAESLVEDGGLR